MIKLYQCYSCWYVFDEALVRSGKHIACSCGDQHFKAVNPTWFNVLKYVMFHKMRAIKRILGRENA